MKFNKFTLSELTLTLFTVVISNLVSSVTSTTVPSSRRYVQAIMFTTAFVGIQARASVV